MNIYIRKQSISATIVVDGKTKELVKRLKNNQIAIIQHFQLDCVAAKELIRKKPLAVINFSNSITDALPVSGAKMLVANGILLFDVITNTTLFSNLKDNMHVTISLRKGLLTCSELKQSVQIQAITMECANIALQQSFQKYNLLYEKFIANTLEFALKEHNTFVQPFPKVQLKTSLQQQEVVIVTRGLEALEDLIAITPYIRKSKPVLIGVDGGADIILSAGFVPHIVIGDMDSVSDDAIRLINERVIHSYPNGKTPGLNRVQSLGLNYNLLPFIGTSEDVAILLAFEHGASKIVLVGSHSHMLDFLEKGRKGMASTMLARIKAGHLITDVKGIHSILAHSSLGEMEFDRIDHYTGLQ